jgi:hypothetical protein
MHRWLANKVPRACFIDLIGVILSCIRRVFLPNAAKDAADQRQGNTFMKQTPVTDILARLKLSLI